MFMVPVILTFAVEYFGHLMGDDDDDEDGALGGWRYVQRILQGVSEYDKTNYTIVPLKLDEKGNSVYLRIPRSDAGRLLAAILRKALRTSRGDAGVFESMATIVDYTAGQLPGLSPSLVLADDVVKFASNQNIYDAFRNRAVFTRDEMDAAGAGYYKPKAAKFLRYEFQQMGGGIIYRVSGSEDRPEERTPAQKVLELPVVSNILGRFVRISNYGRLEMLRKVEAHERGKEAIGREKERAAVGAALRDYQKLPPPRRTRAEQQRIARDLVDTLYPNEPASEKREDRSRILKKIRMGVTRGGTDALVDAVMSAGSTQQRVAIIREALKGREEREAWAKQARKENVISDDVAKALRRSEVPR
jgi:hypothetical protein